MQAVLTSDVRFLLDQVDLKKVKKDLTIKLWDYSKKKITTVTAYKVDHKFIYTPRQYGAAYANDNNITVVDRTSQGESIGGMKKLLLREGQDKFIEELESYFSPHAAKYDCRVRAHAGFGKTVCSLEYIRRRGRTALIVVDQKFLRDQWISEAKNKFGLKDNDIGIVQGKLCEYRGKKLVVGMVQTLYNRKYEDDLYNYFGTVVFDECDTVGAEKFSQVLLQFSASVRFGVSATPDRDDKLQKLLEVNLGDVEVKIKNKHKKSMASYIEYDGVLSWYANVSPKDGRFITEISRDDRRNALLVWAVKELYGRGRTVLVVSDRAEHLHNLFCMCADKGIPSEEMGVVTTYDHIWKYAKDATPSHKPAGLIKDAEYTPVKLQMLKKKIPKAKLEDRRDNRRVRFSTYSMFKKGVDVPAVDTGIDATPRAKAQQVHGRILRTMAGKKTPLWVTIRDIMSYKAEFKFLKRISEYEESNAEIYQWHPRKGTRKINTSKLRTEVIRRGAELKKARIVIAPDGKNTVVMRGIASG